MKKIKRILACSVLTAVALCAAAMASAQNKPLDLASFVKLMHEEDRTNIGQTFPKGISVVDASGKSVDLATVVRGPVALLRVDPKCGPCEELLTYLRANGEDYAKENKATVVVLQVKDEGHKSLGLPGAVAEYHTRDRLESGFLAGQIAPTVFFFDGNQKLIARRAGVTTPQAFLAYPNGK